MPPPASPIKHTADSKQIGLRFASSIESVLRRLRLDRVTVLDKDREKLNKCYAPGHPDYTEYEGDFQSSEAYRFLEKVANDLRRNPAQRTFIVDHNDAKCTEDSVWVSLPKWQHDNDLPSIYWHVVTERSIEKSVFREVFSDCDWSIEHGDGPRGTTFVSKYVYVDENDGPDAHKAFKRHYGTLFSDQPEVVAQQGLECGAELYSAAARFGTFPKPVVRIFRCAPREALIEGITRVMKQQLSDNVIDIWIRHPEAPDKMLEGFGKYEFQLDDASKSPLELLTRMIVSEEAADDGTVVSISSPLSADNYYHIKSSMHVSVPQEIPETGIDAPNDSAGVSPLNSPVTHIDSTVPAPFCVEAVLSPSMTSNNPTIEETTTPISNDAITPKRGSARRSNSSNSENEVEGNDVETHNKKVNSEQKQKGKGRKTSQKSFTSTPVKKGPPGTTSQKSSVSGNSTSKDKEEFEGAARVDESSEEPAHTGKKTPSRKKSSKKSSKSPTRTQPSPSSSFHEEKKVVDDESRDLNNNASSPPPCSGMQNPDPAEILKESEKNLVCSSCKKSKKKHDYSKAQLKKKDERRCVDCIQNNI